MKAVCGLIALAASLASIVGSDGFICGMQAYADADPAAQRGQETFQGYLDELERESGRLEAEKGLRELELFLHEEIVRKQLELKRLEQQISAARRASSEVARAPVLKVAERRRAEVVGEEEEAERESVSILPGRIPPSKGQVLIAAVHLKRGKLREVRVLDEDADSVYAELPFVRFSIPKDEIETIEPSLLSEEEYRFKLGDYYDNVPASRWYYHAMVEYNRVLDLNPDNKPAQEKLKKCREELDEILDRERKQKREHYIPQRPPRVIEAPRNEPLVPLERTEQDLSQNVRGPLEVYHYHQPLITRRCPTPDAGRFIMPGQFGAVPPFVPLDVNGSILLISVL